jgi:GT2 family glycosyltransferase
MAFRFFKKSPRNETAYREWTRLTKIPNHLHPESVDFPSIDIVIIYYNSSESIEKCLDSILQSFYPKEKIKVILSDNSDCPKFSSVIETYKDKLSLLSFRNEVNIGFGRACNKNASYGQNDIILFLNPDAALEKDSLPILAHAYNQRSNNHFGAWEMRQIPYEHPKFYNPVTLEIEWASGGCLAVERSLFDQIHGFDDEMFLYVEDVEISWRIRQEGYKIQYLPHAKVYHNSYPNADEIKPIQFYNSIINNGYLCWKMGTATNIAHFYQRFSGIYKSPPRLPRVKSELIKAWIKSLTMIPQALGHRIKHVPKESSTVSRFINWDYELHREGTWEAYKKPKDIPFICLFLIINETNDSHFIDSLGTIQNQTLPYSKLVIIAKGESSLNKEILKDLHHFEVLTFSTEIDKESKIKEFVAKNPSWAFGILNDSDLLFPDHIETLCGSWEKNKSVISGHCEVDVKPISNQPGRYAVLPQKLISPNIQNLSIGNSTGLFRTEHLLDILNEKVSNQEDYITVPKTTIIRKRTI